MPGYNAWAWRAMDPFGSHLEGVIKHATGNVLKRSRDAYEEHSPVYKVQKLEEKYPSESSAMPYGRSRRYRPRRGRLGRRRAIRRVRRTFRRTGRVPRAPKQAVYRWMKIARGFTRTMTSGAISILPVSLTNMNDPFAASANNQPLYYDQYSAIWSKAKVMKVAVRARFQSNTSAEPIVCGITPRNAGDSDLTVYEHYIELKRTRHTIISPDQDHALLGASIDVPKWLKIKNVHDADELAFNLDGSATGPGLQAQIDVWCQPFDVATTSDCDLIVEVWYKVMLYDPVTPSRSAHS